ncbi:O-antigen ligase family protein [Cohnella yongneupensis]|uniref:O-antigen ligase family protein n=1 Tax=Cohnella yongneupensis TaxID=425006 RepID=A0ABW0R2U3_9BACL
MGASKKTSTINNQMDLLSYLTGGMIILFLLVSLFNYGYFNGVGLHSANQILFEKSLMYGVMFGIPAFIFALMYILRSKQFERKHLLTLAGLIIPLVYLISSFNAESSYLSRISVLFSVAVYAFYLTGIYLSDNKKIINLLLQAYLTIGSLFVLYGFTYLIGNRYKLDSLMFVENVRLASVFTYPNAYAVFLLTLVLVNLHYLVKVCKTWVLLSLGFSLALITASLLLTLSRGAIIAIPVIALVTLIVSGFRKQILMSVYFVVSMILSLLIQSYLTNSGNEVYQSTQQMIAAQQLITTVGWFTSDSLSGWLRVLGIAVAMSIFVLFFNKYLLSRLANRLEQWEHKKSSRYWLPGVFVILCVIGIIVIGTGVLNSILPAALSERLSSINFQQHSVLERLTFYKDSISMWLDRPLVGGGGGAWEALYDQYQSYPYSSSQTHSYPVQLLVETGIIGLLLTSLFILYIVISYVVRYFREKAADGSESLLVLLIALSILIHSLIDFEMSYFLFNAIVFFCLGILAGKHNEPITNVSLVKRQIVIKRVTGAAWGVIAIVLLYSVSTTLYVNGKYLTSSKQLQVQQGMDRVMATIEAGLKQLPNHPYLLERAAGLNYQAYEQTKDKNYLNIADQYLNRLSESEPKYRALPNISYTRAMVMGDKQLAVNSLDLAIQHYPYELSYYEQSIIDRYNLWKEAYDRSDRASMESESKKIADIYGQVQEQVKKLQELPKAIIINRAYMVTPNMRLNVGKLAFYEEKYEVAASELKQGLMEQLTGAVDQEIARYYLASIRKLGQDDDALYQKLVAANSNEASQLQALLE